MTILCRDETHVYLKDAPYCTCGGQINAPQPMTGMMGWFGTGYAIPGYKPQAAQPANEIPLDIFRMAQAVNATHLSADGSKAYRYHYGNALVCFWDEEAKEFGTWFNYLVEIPEDVVAIDAE